MPNERVLVTGATGMIGTAVIRRLLDDGYIVRAYVHRESIGKLPTHPKLEVAIGDMRDALPRSSPKVCGPRINNSAMIANSPMRK